MMHSSQESTLRKYVNVQLLEQVIEVDIDRLIARLSRERGVMVSNNIARKWRRTIEDSVVSSVQKCCSAHTVLPNLDAIIQKELQKLEMGLLESIQREHHGKSRPPAHRLRCVIKHFFGRMNVRMPVKRQNSIALNRLVP